LLLEEALGKYPHSSDPGTLATDLAEALALCGQFEAARQAMETAFASAERLGETFFFPELYRVMGVVMAIGPPEPRRPRVGFCALSSAPAGKEAWALSCAPPRAWRAFIKAPGTPRKPATWWLPRIIASQKGLTHRIWSPPDYCWSSSMNR
jgi:hypothetical protein